MPTLIFSELPHQGLALQKSKDKERTCQTLHNTTNQNLYQNKRKVTKKAGRLTVFSSSNVGEEAEGLGLQLGGSFSPFRWPQVIVFIGNDGLIHWGSTVYNMVFNWQITATTEKAGLVKHTLSFQYDREHQQNNFHV